MAHVKQPLSEAIECYKAGCPAKERGRETAIAQGWQVPEQPLHSHDFNRLVLCPEHLAAVRRIGFSL